MEGSGSAPGLGQPQATMCKKERIGPGRTSRNILIVFFQSEVSLSTQQNPNHRAFFIQSCSIFRSIEGERPKHGREHNGVSVGINFAQGNGWSGIN
jgi:hypothetical protein